jgi:putative heme-binding domain-containing protein
LAVILGLAEGLASTRFSLREVLVNRSRDSDLVESIRPSVLRAENVAFAQDASLDQRLRAVRLISRIGLNARRLPELLEANQPAPLQTAAARALGESKDDGVAEKVFGRWTTYLGSTRRAILDVAPKSPALAAALLTQLEKGAISPGEISPVVRQGLLRRGDLKSRFEKLISHETPSDRAEVIKGFQTALDLEGDSKRGAELFVRTCMVCHSTKGVGGHVGPDLSGIGSKPNFALLIDILDPSRQISPDYLNYAVETDDGKQVNGFIAAETATSLTLRRPNEPDETLLRSQIKSLRVEVKSLMPEGLEQGITPQNMADLLAFLRYPDSQYLSSVKTK